MLQNYSWTWSCTSSIDKIMIWVSTIFNWRLENGTIISCTIVFQLKMILSQSCETVFQSLKSFHEPWITLNWNQSQLHCCQEHQNAFWFTYKCSLSLWPPDCHHLCQSSFAYCTYSLPPHSCITSMHITVQANNVTVLLEQNVYTYQTFYALLHKSNNVQELLEQKCPDFTNILHPSQ